MSKTVCRRGYRDRQNCLQQGSSINDVTFEGEGGVQPSVTICDVGVWGGLRVVTTCKAVIFQSLWLVCDVYAGMNTLHAAGCLSMEWVSL